MPHARSSKFDMFAYSGSTMTVRDKDMWFGDPCYFFDNDNSVNSEMWSEFCSMMYPNGEDGELSDQGTLVVDGHEVLYMSTAWGDGSYHASAGGKSADCGVDAGMLALVPMELVRKMNPDPEKLKRVEELGLVLENFSGTVEAEVGERKGWSRSGFSWTGDLTCVTDWSDQEDEEYDDGADEYEEENEEEELA